MSISDVSDEVLCCLSECRVPVYNDIVFEVEDDHVVVKDSGTIEGLHEGDIVVAINGHFIQSYTSDKSTLESIIVGLLEENTNQEFVIRVLPITNRFVSHNAIIKHCILEESQLNNFTEKLGDFISNFHKLSICAFKSQNYVEAIKLANKSISLCIDCDNNTEIFEVHVHCQTTIGLSKELMGDAEGAVKAFKAVLAMMHIKFSNHVDCVVHALSIPSLKGLLRIYFRRRMYKMVHKVAHLMLVACEGNGSSASEDAAMAWSHLGKVCHAQKGEHECFEHELKALEIRRKITHSSSTSEESISCGLNLVESLLTVASARMALGDLSAQTEDLLQESLTLVTKISASCCCEHLHCDILSAQSSLHHMRGDFLLAETVRRSELHRRDSIFSSLASHDRRKFVGKYLRSMWELSSILLIVGDPAEARRLRERTVCMAEKVLGSAHRKTRYYRSEHHSIEKDCKSDSTHDGENVVLMCEK